MSFWNRNKPANESFTEMNEIFSRHAKSVNFVPRPGFKEALFIRLESARHAVSMSKVSFRALFFSGRRTFATVGVTALVVVVIATVVLQPFYGVKTVFAQDNFILTAEDSDFLGIEPGGSFILESKEPVSVADVKDKLVSNVAEEIELNQISDKKIRLSFGEDLPAAEVVTFALSSETTSVNGETVDRPYYWAFQVKSPFRVVGTLPGNQTSGVAMDAGFEVTFNYEDISLKDFEKAFSVSPEIKGHVEQSRRTFVFVPEEKLQSRTVYTVTINSDLGLRGSSDTLGEDYVYSFETGDDDEYRGSDFWVDSRYLAVKPSEKVSLPYSAWSNEVSEEDIKVKVEIKQFVSQVFASDFQQYVTALQKSRTSEWQQFVSLDYLTVGSNLSLVATFEAEKVAAGWQKYAIFPESLPRGYYAVDLSCFGEHRFVFIESSQITAYAAKAVNETLVWTNSAENHAPISGATVNFVGFEDQKVKTDVNGLAVLSIDASWTSADYAVRDLLEIRSGSEAIVLPLGINYQPFYSMSGEASVAPILSTSQNYWTYLYSDRPMYQLSDTVKFWGYAEKRDSGEKPEELRVTVGRRGGCSRFGCGVLEDNLVFDEVKVQVSEAGTFSGQLDLKNIPESRYQISVYLGSELLTERNISAIEYVKPAYTLSITPDTDAVWTKESFGFTVHGEFFEGTPVKGLKVVATYEGQGQELTLDEVGNARGTFVSTDWVAEDNGFDLTWMSVEPARPEEAGISATNQVMVFGPKVYLDSDWQNNNIENGVGTIKATVRNVQPINSWDPKVFAPTVRNNQIVTGTLVETTYNKIEDGTTYDFVRKEVIKNYRYETVEKNIADFSLISDQNGEIFYQFPITNPEANYHVKLKARDENSKEAECKIYVWQKDEQFFYGFQPYLQFKDLNISEGQEGEFPGYNVGEQVRLQVQKDGAAFVPETQGRFLFFRAQRGIQEKDFQTSVDYDFTFAKEDVPVISVYGVYFNGSAYALIDDWGWGGGHRTVYFDKNQRELTVAVQADKESYRPGEEVNLSVRTSDKVGQVVSAEVNLNVVDEAFYSLVSESVDTLDGLYSYVSDGVLSTEASSSFAETRSVGAEMGGGGERGRVDFKDTADFFAITTDENGQANYKFNLPDNITSWRVTAQAIAPETKSAGNTTINLNASLPFFVVPVMRESYLLDDQPIILLRASGTDIGSGSSVEYSIKVWDTETQETKIALANETVRFILPELSEGEHEITITGTSGNLQDTITRSIKIVKSRLLEPIVSKVELSEATQITGAIDGLTYVTFVDAGRGRYYSYLKEMAWTFGDRADESLARVLSQEMLNEYFGENQAVSELITSSYQTDGVHLLPYGDVDFGLSVKVAMLGGASFDKNGLIRYFSGQLYGGEVLNAEEASQAYAALAGLGEPVLAEVQRLAKENDLGFTEKLYLALAMTLSGDSEDARVVYRELSKELIEEYGYAYLPSDDLETQGEQTVLLAILAGALKEEKAESLYDYVFEQNHGQTVLVLEQVLCLKDALKNSSSQKAEVSYTLEGERRKNQLENGQVLTLPLTPDEFSALTPKVEVGKVMALSVYNQPLVSLGTDVDNQLKLTRKYSTDNGSVKTEFNEGDLIRVDIKYDLPLSGEGKTEPFELFQVTDIVPSGLSVLRPLWYQDDICNTWPDNLEGQRISFTINNSEQLEHWKCDFYTITYYARVVTPGTYVAEPTFIRSVNDSSDYNYLSEAAIITIK